MIHEYKDDKRDREDLQYDQMVNQSKILAALRPLMKWSAVIVLNVVYCMVQLILCHNKN